MNPAPAADVLADRAVPSGLHDQGRGVRQERQAGSNVPASPPSRSDPTAAPGTQEASSAPAPSGGPATSSGPAVPSAGSAAAYEAEERRQEAFDIAWRFLAHRDRTEAEVRRNFTRKRIDPALVEEVVAALLEGGYVDDATFARRFVEDRRNLDGWGSERIERRLTELGVERATIRAALASGGGDEEAGEGAYDELGAACDLLARRFPHPPRTPRDLERALGFLVRKGYDLELAHDALRKHAGVTIED